MEIRRLIDNGTVKGSEMLKESGKQLQEELSIYVLLINVYISIRHHVGTVLGALKFYKGGKYRT